MTRKWLAGAWISCIALMGAQASFGADAADREAARQAAAEKRAEARRATETRREEARKERESAREEKRSKKGATTTASDGKRSSNESIETQQRTADAFAEKKRGATDESKLRPPTTAPSDKFAASSSASSSADIDKQLRDEESRHAKTIEQLKRDLETAKAARDRTATKAAQAAIEKEVARYQKLRTDLERRKLSATESPSAKSRTGSGADNRKPIAPIEDRSAAEK